MEHANKKVSNLHIFISASIVSDLEPPYSIVLVVIMFLVFFFFRALLSAFLVMISVVALSVVTMMSLIIFIAAAVMISTRAVTKVPITISAMIVPVHAVSAMKSGKKIKLHILEVGNVRDLK